MWCAAAEGGAQVVAAWLDEGGGVDVRCAERKCTTLLMAAACGGQEAIARMLLQRGASVNLQGSHGGTALIAAAVSGQTTTVQVLLDAKADASLQTALGTALMWAENGKHAAAAQLLRQHAKGQVAAAEARAAAAAAQATAAADAMAAELLGEEAVEKKAATKKAEGKNLTITLTLASPN